MTSKQRRSIKKGWIIPVVIVIFISILLLALYFFTDLFSEKKPADNLTAHNKIENEVTEENEANESLNDANNTEVNNNKVTENNTGVENEEELEEILDIRTLSDKIIQALADRDMETVGRYADKEEGLLFSPYVYVTENAVVFEQAEISTMLDQEQTYHWGDYDGKGTPIELTPTDYFAEFLEMDVFLDPDEVLLDDLQARGNTLNNLAEVYPNARVIEYYHDGTEEYTGIDWASLLLVYNEDETGELHLIAIIRDMWTI